MTGIGIGSPRFRVGVIVVLLVLWVCAVVPLAMHPLADVHNTWWIAAGILVGFAGTVLLAVSKHSEQRQTAVAMRARRRSPARVQWDASTDGAEWYPSQRIPNPQPVPVAAPSPVTVNVQNLHVHMGPVSYPAWVESGPTLNGHVTPELPSGLDR